MRDHAEIGLLTTAIPRPPKEETPEERQKREHAEWVESLRIDQNMPQLTPEIIVKSTQAKRGPWRTITQILKDNAEEARRRKLEREHPEILPIPEPEFD